MGKQIGFLQSTKDELEMIYFLSKGLNLLALPWSIDDNNIQPEALAKSTLNNLIIIKQEHWSIIKSSLILRKDDNGEHYYSTRDLSGCYLEWTKSELNHKEHPNFNYATGRLYFDTPSSYKNYDHELVKEYTKLYNKAVSFIKRTYPMKTNENKPEFIGKHLYDDILNKKIILLHRNINVGDLEWKNLELIANK